MRRGCRCHFHLTCAPAQRFGPRPIDLDILFYGTRRINDEALTVPHPRISERPFVLAPLSDVAVPSDVGTPLGDAVAAWAKSGGGARVGCNGLVRVLPLPGKRLLKLDGKTTRLMAVVNATPDSFSEGGGAAPSARAVADAAIRLAASGADVVDVGAQSTRPGAAALSAEDELARLLPVLDLLDGGDALGRDCVLSVDTFHASVAAAAIERGAAIINDVSGGREDAAMFATVASSGAAMVVSHARGRMADVHLRRHAYYPRGVVPAVAGELSERVRTALVDSHLPPWRILLDPGLGFSKTPGQNAELLARLGRLRGLCPPACASAWLVGPSRKGFLATLVQAAEQRRGDSGGGVAPGEESSGGGGAVPPLRAAAAPPPLRPPADRDWATAAAVAAAAAGGAAFVRAHNLGAMRDVAAVADALLR